MNSVPDAAGFVATVRQALAEPLAAPAARTPGGVALPGALVMVLVDGAALEVVALALPEVLRALGAPFLRRPLLVASSEVGECPPRAEVVRILGPLVPGATFVAHDPDASHHFRPGSTSRGLPIELDDVVLEAETVVTVGPVRLDDRSGPTGGAGLVFPGLASRRVRELHRTSGRAQGRERDGRERWLDAEEVREHVLVDFQLCWVESAGGRAEAWAGAGRAAEQAARRALRCVP